MSTIVTRASKGSALTWTEGDQNLTNLNTDKIENVVDDTTPQLGGNLDVNGNSIVSVSNGNITITPNGTGSVVIDGNTFPQTQGAEGEVLTADGSGLVEWKLPGPVVSLVYNAEATTISKGTVVYVFGSNGTLISVKKAVNTGETTSAQVLGITTEDIAAGSTGNVMSQGVIKGLTTTGLTEGGAIYLSSTAGTWTQTKPSAPNHLVYLGFVETAGSNGRIYVRVQNGYELDELHNVSITSTPSNGQVLAYETATSLWKPATPATGTVTSVAGTGTVNGLTLTGTVTSTGNLTLGGTLDLSSPPAIGGSAAAAVSATTLTFKDPREALYDLGTTGGTIAPNVANGSVQKITLNSALTINAFTSPQAGQSVTLIIYGGTSYTSITSTMKFAGGIKTLTGTAGCIDILSIYYDGTNYFASLNKGFA